MHETSFAFTRRLTVALEPRDEAIPSDWRKGLPYLNGRLATLRELEPADGPHLLALLATPEVMRFLSPPPQSLERFTGFIETTRIDYHSYGDFGPAQSNRSSVVERFTLAADGVNLKYDITVTDPVIFTGTWAWGGAFLYRDGAEIKPWSCGADRG